MTETGFRSSPRHDPNSGRRRDHYAAKAFAEGLKLPVWLGSLGTFLASMLAGLVAGAINGFINNVIYGLTLSPVSTVYALTSWT
ncbi:hypothetical protein FD23_GL001206 [Lactobacillus delbrueckii subsp. delbrueckii DSM 20074 = JCM 1012]|nr:hypothetical protein FD23_GL001206 [Lactobacillus delbrueckii subsp. delbrueckii DSM 20074 = JCM 1012]